MVMLLRGKVRRAGVSVLCVTAVAVLSPIAIGAEPVVVINAQPAPDAGTHATPVLDVAAIPASAIGPHRDWQVTPGADLTAESSFISPAGPHANWPASDYLSIATEQNVVSNASPTRINPGPQPVFVTAAPTAPVHAPIHEGRTHAGAARVAITRYNRKLVRTHGNDDAPSQPVVADPGYNLVECVAGCSSAVSKIVYYAPRLSSQTGQPFEPAGVQTAAASPPAPADMATITCVAGCYATPKSYVARRVPAPEQRAELNARSASGIVTLASVVPTATSLQVVHPVATRVVVRRPKPHSVAHQGRKPSVLRIARSIKRDRLLPRRTWTMVAARD